MYELQNINQNILNNLVINITKLLIKKQYMYLNKAIEYAVRKELPNKPKYIMEALIKKLKRL